MGKKRDIQQIDAIARLFNIDERQRRRFGEFIEQQKKYGDRGSLNKRGDFTYQELEQKAREFIDLN